MTYLIIDFKKVNKIYSKKCPIENINEIINVAVESNVVKNKHQIDKWIDRAVLPVLKSLKIDNALPLNIEELVKKGNQRSIVWQSASLTLEVKGAKSLFRVYCFSLTTNKDSMYLITRSLPFGFNEHFFQRLVDRQAWHVEKIIYESVFNEYLKRLPEIVLVMFFLKLSENKINAPIRFFNGVALTNVTATNNAMLYHKFYFRKETQPYLDNYAQDPVHRDKYKAEQGCFAGMDNIGLFLNFSTWITSEEATELQNRFCDFVTDYVIRLGDGFKCLIREHGHRELNYVESSELAEIFIAFSEKVNQNFSDFEQRNIFFESKSQKKLEKYEITMD